MNAHGVPRLHTQHNSSQKTLGLPAVMSLSKSSLSRLVDVFKHTLLWRIYKANFVLHPQTGAQTRYLRRVCGDGRWLPNAAYSQYIHVAIRTVHTYCDYNQIISLFLPFFRCWPSTVYKLMFVLYNETMNYVNMYVERLIFVCAILCVQV